MSNTRNTHERGGVLVSETLAFVKLSETPNSFAATSTVFCLNGVHVVIAAPNSRELEKFLSSCDLPLPPWNPVNFQSIKIEGNKPTKPTKAAP